MNENQTQMDTKQANKRRRRIEEEDFN